METQGNALDEALLHREEVHFGVINPAHSGIRLPIESKCIP